MRLTCRKLQSGPDSGRNAQRPVDWVNGSQDSFDAKPLWHLAYARQGTSRIDHRRCSQSVQPPRCIGCVSLSGASSVSISAWLMIPSDSATWAMVPPLASAVLAMSAAFS